MGLLRPLGQGQGYLKCGFQGFSGSGKTFTAIDLAIGVREFTGLTGPIAFFDTEGGSEYVAKKVRERTGTDLVGVRSQAFDALLDTVYEAEETGASVLIVDSVTHVWAELQRAHLAKVNENRSRRKLPRRYSLEFQDWGPVKERWSAWTSAFLNTKLHIIFCGRAGFSYDHETNEETGKKDLVKTGTKMKAENEFGYEPSLMVEMERVTVNKRRLHRAVIIKDRFDVMMGKQFDNPTFATFLPHVELLRPGAHAPIDTAVRSAALVDDEGNDDRRLRTILAEEIQGELVAAFPGQSAAEKSAKATLVNDAFNTRSWTAVEGMSAERLRGGLDFLKRRLNEMREAQNMGDAQ